MLNWSVITIQALQDLWLGLIKFIPALIGALIVFFLGWFISLGLGRLVAELLKKLKFNQIFDRAGWKDAMEKAELKVNMADFVGAICKWVVAIVFLVASVEILGLTQFALFLTGVLAYIPNVIVAVLIFVVAVIIADIVEKLVRVSVEGTKVGHGLLAGSIAKWSIWIFALLTILIQLKIAPSLLQTFFAGFVYLFTIAGGIAFGLGGKDIAADVLNEIRKKFKE